MQEEIKLFVIASCSEMGRRRVDKAIIHPVISTYNATTKNFPSSFSFATLFFFIYLLNKKVTDEVVLSLFSL